MAGIDLDAYDTRTDHKPVEYLIVESVDVDACQIERGTSIARRDRIDCIFIGIDIAVLATDTGVAGKCLFQLCEPRAIAFDHKPMPTVQNELSGVRETDAVAGADLKTRPVLNVDHFEDLFNNAVLPVLRKYMFFIFEKVWWHRVLALSGPRR